MSNVECLTLVSCVLTCSLLLPETASHCSAICLACACGSSCIVSRIEILFVALVAFFRSRLLVRRAFAIIPILMKFVLCYVGLRPYDST